MLGRLLKKIKSQKDLENAIIEARTEKIISGEEEKLLKNVINLWQKEIEDIMVPRTEMVCIAHDKRVKDAIHIHLKEGFSRIPVYYKNMDTIIGILHCKDLFRFLNALDTPVVEVIRMPLFLTAHTPIISAIRRLQEEHQTMAIVVDDYGGVAGLVTLEDLVEEIIGDVKDEFDKKEPLFRLTKDGEYIMKAQIELHTFNEIFKTNLKSADVNTIAGIILKHLERIPKKGEEIKIDNLLIKIIDADEQKIKKIAVKKCS